MGGADGSVPRRRSSLPKETKMSASILVAYATKYGSTQEVAEAVAAALREELIECLQHR